MNTPPLFPVQQRADKVMDGPNREDDAMRTSQSRAVPVSRAVVGALAGFVLAAAVLCAGAVAPAAAPAATVSGVLKGAVGYKVLLVQANGKARKATIRTSAGSFSIRGAKPAGATLQLVGPDGSYYGPVMLKTTATRAFGFIRGASSLKLGVLTLKGGYALRGEPRSAGTRRSRRPPPRRRAEDR